MERVILANQYRILAKIDLESSNRYKELIEIVENGYEIFYPMIDEWHSEELPESEGELILNVLNLYRAIEDVKRRSRSKDLTSHRLAIFPGFDGNNETNEMEFCRFLIVRQGKFEEQKQYVSRNDYFNSHMPMKEKYRKMLKI